MTLETTITEAAKAASLATEAIRAAHKATIGDAPMAEPALLAILERQAIIARELNTYASIARSGT